MTFNPQERLGRLKMGQLRILGKRCWVKPSRSKKETIDRLVGQAEIKTTFDSVTLTWKTEFCEGLTAMLGRDCNRIAREIGKVLMRKSPYLSLLSSVENK